MTRTLTISLVTMGDPGRLTGGYLYHRRMVDAAPAHGAEITFVSVPDTTPVAAVLGGRPAVARAAAADVIVVDSIVAAAVAPWLGRRGLPPVAASLHQPPGGIDHGPVRTRLQAPLDKLAYRRCRVLLAASDHLAEQLVASGLDRSRIRVVAPGCDVAGDVTPEPVELRGGRRAALLCVGNWVTRKGIVDLLDAFADLPHDAATLHLVGDPDTEPGYGRLVTARLAQADLAGRVVVHGPVDRARVAALYASADAFALASLREPFGTVYAEAMAAGLPVVGWRAGNLPYLADDRVEGLLVEPGDRRGLTAALRLMADDAAVRRRLAEAAGRRAASFPTWAECGRRFFAAVREARG